MSVSKIVAAAASGVGGAGLDVDEVFSTFLYKGTYYNEDGDKVTVNNGIDLSGEGGLVWLKSRENTRRHMLFDTERGASKSLSSNNTAANYTGDPLDSFTSTGFITGDNSETNEQDIDYVSWTFRNSPMFQVLTWTGDGTSNRSISHNLGSKPGAIFMKRTDTTDNWYVGCWNGMPHSNGWKLNTTDSVSTYGYFGNNAPTSTSFEITNFNGANASGGTYVAYLFAHHANDGSATGFGPNGDSPVISVGSYTGNGSSTGPSVNLGFEPQWLLLKNASTAYNWIIVDVMRGFSAAPQANTLFPSATNAEDPAGTRVKPTSTGFEIITSSFDYNKSGDTFVWMAIRRGPLAEPTSATDVFAIDTYDATTLPSFKSSFVTDFALYKNATSVQDWKAVTRKLGATRLVPNATTSETGEGDVTWDYMNGWYSNSGTYTNIYAWMWKRAPSYFDVTTWSGTGSARTVPHNLGLHGAVPEMIWVKRRSGTRSWFVYHSALGNTGRIKLDTTDAGATGYGDWNSTTPTSSVFSVGSGTNTNGNGETYIAYLFASSNVSKVGSYTGNGSTTGPIVDCGFAARFVLIKRTDSTGDWILHDSTRGITSGDDKTLKLNSTAAETTGQVLNPHSSGFQLATADSFANASSGTYIFYAIA